MGLIDRSIDCSVKRCRPAWSIRMIRRCLKWSGAPLCSGICCDNRVGRVTAEVADAALAQLGIPRSTLFRAVARFRRTRRASSLLPLKRGTRDGSLLLDPRIERIIEEQIERFWLKKEKPRFSALVERVHDACHVEGLRAPHRKTIKRRVVDLNPLAAARRRGQGALEAASTPSPVAPADIISGRVTRKPPRHDLLRPVK